MNAVTKEHSTPELVAALCRELNLLARREEQAAAEEACRVPYWQSCPPSVQARWTAARLLRSDADRLESSLGSLAEVMLRTWRP